MNNTKSYENWQCSGSSRGPAAELENTAKPSTPDSLSSVASPSLAGCLVARDPDCVAFGFFYGMGGFFRIYAGKGFFSFCGKICKSVILRLSIALWIMCEDSHL